MTNRLPRRTIISGIASSFAGCLGSSSSGDTASSNDTKTQRPTAAQIRIGTRTNSKPTTKRETEAKHYDLFAVGGQSNASGRGDSSNSPNPTAGNAIEYVNESNEIKDPLDDPVQQNNDESDTGSAWPSFCVTYYEITGRPVAIVGAAKGATSQHSDADAGVGNWDSSGELTHDLITSVNNAISEIESRGYSVTFRGILWSQGERDAQQINEGEITKSNYKTALENMIARFRTAFGSDMPFWIFETGYWDGHRETQGFQDVQTVQQEVALSQNHTWMVSDKQKTFPSLGYTDGGLHYDQKGYNIMGETGGINVAARLWPIEIFG